MNRSQFKLIQKSQEKFLPEADRSAGQLGEELVASALRKSAKKLNSKFHIYQSIRIPRLQGRGKYEMDLLLVSEAGVLCLEVKHWGGALEASKSSWLQKKRHGDKQMKDPVRDLSDKKQSLIKWLAERGVNLAQSKVHTLVVMSNENASLGASLRRSSQVCKLTGLEELVLKFCGKAKGGFFSKKKVSAPWDLGLVHQHLSILPTWDEIQLHGGRVYWGDILGFQIRMIGQNSLQRSDVRSIKVKAFRNLLALFFKPKIVVETWDGVRCKYDLHPQAELRLRHGGQVSEEIIPLIHVKSLSLGWENQDYYNN